MLFKPQERGVLEARCPISLFKISGGCEDLLSIATACGGSYKGQVWEEEGGQCFKKEMEHDEMTSSKLIVRIFFKSQSCVSVGNGSKTKFWHDVWCEGSALRGYFPTCLVFLPTKMLGIWFVAKKMRPFIKPEIAKEISWLGSRAGGVIFAALQWKRRWVSMEYF